MKQAAARVGVALVVSCAAIAAQAQGTNDAWFYNSTGTTRLTVANAPATVGALAPINLNTWSGTEANFVATSGDSQTLRNLSAAAGSGSGLTHWQGGGQYNWVTQVAPGTSGLSNGDPITVYFDVRIDGQLDTRILSGGGSSYHANTMAFMTLRYGVADMNAAGFDPENRPDLEFRYTGQTSIEAGDVAWDASKVLLKTSSSEATATKQGGLSWVWGGNVSNGTLDHNVSAVSALALSVNTGVLQFSFETFVGRNLLLTGYDRTETFGLVEGASMSWQSLADFAHTFDVELSASDPGITFSGITPGVFQPVPEPASWLLMFAGAAVLLRRVRGSASRA